VPSRSKARIVILEGSWWDEHEVPQILPYFQALAVTHQKELEITHRTFRTKEDIAFYVAEIPKNAGVMLYIACHGDQGVLRPSGDTVIPLSEVADALKKAPSGAISFVHFGSCEMVVPGRRRECHRLIREACNAIWVSGYTKQVDWLPSTFLDLMLATSIFAPQHGKTDGRAGRINHNANKFFEMYEQTARSLGFSALSAHTDGDRLYPAALH